MNTSFEVHTKRMCSMKLAHYTNTNNDLTAKIMHINFKRATVL